jgi:integrase
MALAMSRPWKHPKTGVYWLRKRIPDDLRAPAAAKRLHLEARAELDPRWENLRTGPKTLTEREAHDLVAIVHDRWLEVHRDNPSEQGFWRLALGDKLWPLPPLINSIDLKTFLSDFDQNFIKRQKMENWCSEVAVECLKSKGLIVDEPSRLKLAKAVAAAVQRASLKLAQWAAGEFSHDLLGASQAWAHHNAPASSAKSGKPISFDELVKGWASEKRPTEKTHYEWRRVVGQFAVFLGHDDAGRVKVDDVIAWKTQLIKNGLRPKTIRDAKLAPVRAILQWAVDNRRLPSNPAERVTIDVKVKASESIRGFKDEEASLVLSASLREKDPVRRWVPWLCAYSGARLSEVCQLRVEDILPIDGIWCMKFDPEAGSLKTRSSERAVPLHPAVLERGFLEFIQSVGSGPLFANLTPDKFGSRGGNGTKILGRWVRSLGLTDDRISPNHSWRHRLKTLGRQHELAPDIVNAITGHGKRSVADSYGEFPITALYRELKKIPPIQLAKIS